MTPEEFRALEARRQVLLNRIGTAEKALRSALHAHNLGDMGRTHLERAMAHLCEAHIFICENKPVRTVQQLVQDLNHIQQVMDEARRGKFQRI